MKIAQKLLPIAGPPISVSNKRLCVHPPFTFRKFIRIYEVIPLEESEVELEELDNTHNVSAQSSHPEDKVRLNYRWIDGLIGGKMGSVDGWVDRIE